MARERHQDDADLSRRERGRYRLRPVGWWVLLACVVSAVFWALIITGAGWWLCSRLPPSS